jgi:hypothetical protein
VSEASLYPRFMQRRAVKLAFRPGNWLAMRPPLAILAYPLILIAIWRRCPTVITRAQFWAEDGWSWYPDAYVRGWHALFLPHTAYLQTISRLVAFLSQGVPLVWAPTIFAFCALLIQAAPAAFLLSSRMAVEIPPLLARMVLCLLLIAVPGSQEVYVNLTNAQWHLALLAFLVLCAAPPKTRVEEVFDAVALAVSGLSGPFAIFLAPVALLWWIVRRQAAQLRRFAILATTALFQMTLILSLLGQRQPGVLGASLHNFINIVLVQVLGIATLGLHRIEIHRADIAHGWLTNGMPVHSLLAGIFVSAAAVLAICAVIRGSWALRSFLLFVGLEFGASLVQSLPVGQYPAWYILEIAASGRYFFHPMLAWFAIVVTLATDPGPTFRGIGIGLLVVIMWLAVPADWHLPKLQKSSFNSEAVAFAQAPPGTLGHFPTRPFSEMVLIKR